MWRVGMWYGEEKTTAFTYLRGGAIAMTAFLVTGVVYLTLQRGMDAMNRRVTGTYKQGDETGAAPTFAPTNGTSGKNSSPASPFSAPGSPMMPINAAPAYTSAYRPLSQTPVGMSPVAPPQTNIPVAYSIFTNDGERQQAYAALRDLQGAVADFRNYDSHDLQKSLSSGETSAVIKPIAFANEVSAGEENGPSQTQLAAQAEESQKLRIAVERVNGETEGLNAMLSLCVHPQTFPEPLRDGVGVVSRELRTYLQTLRYAAAMPDDRPRLLAAASRHLSQGETALQELKRQAGMQSSGM